MLSFSEGEDFAAGVAGGVEEDGAGAGGDGGFQCIDVEGPVGLGEGDENGLDAKRFEGGDVVAVKGFEQEDFVAGVEQGHGGGVKAGGCAGGGEDFSFRVVGEGVVALLLLGDGLAEAGDAVEAGVDVVPVEDGLDGGLLHRRGDGGVTDSLGEVDAAGLVTEGGHGADFRLHGAGGELAEGEARGGGGKSVGHGEGSFMNSSYICTGGHLERLGLNGGRGRRIHILCMSFRLFPALLNR